MVGARIKYISERSATRCRSRKSLSEISNQAARLGKWPCWAFGKVAAPPLTLYGDRFEPRVWPASAFRLQ